MSLYTDEISLKKLWLWLRSRLVLASGARARFLVGKLIRRFAALQIYPFEPKTNLPYMYGVLSPPTSNVGI